MLDSLLNSKFYNKCKHAFKCIRTRMGPIRRKKHAMLRFMKKDIADLLANGLDTHAFGRMDGLIVELNHASCYDMIEQCCEFIGKQLGSLQKQRECPPETREAVSTLIFAAARFPDLPELCDLRHIFTERYGNFIEPFVSLEFVRRLDSTEFSNEEKLQAMQSIAEELSVSFDAKELKIKLWTTLETERDPIEKGSRKQVQPTLSLSSDQNCNDDVPCESKYKDTLEKGSKKPVNIPMPSSNKQKGDEDATEKGSRKQVPRILPLSSNQNCNDNAPCDSKYKDTLEKGSRKPVNIPVPSSNKLKGDEDALCERKHEATLVHHKEKVDIQLKLTNTQAATDGIDLFDENSRKQQSGKSDEKGNLEKSVSPVETNRRTTHKDVEKLNRRDGRPSEKELMEAVELDLDGLPKKGVGAFKFPETESSKANNLNAKTKEAAKEHRVEKENEEVLHQHPRSIPGGSDHNGRHAESGLRVQRVENQGRPVSPLNGHTRNKDPPYSKPNGLNMKNATEKQAVNAFLYNKQQHLADMGHPVQKGQGLAERTTMRPPYVKPKSNMQPVNGDPEKQSPSDFNKHGIPGQTDRMDSKDVLRPVSVRRRSAKPPAPLDAYGEVPINEKVTNLTPSSYKSHSSKQNSANHDHDRKGSGIDGAVANGKNVESTPSRRTKHTGRRNGALNHNDEYEMFMQRRQPEADDTDIDFGNLLPRNTSGQRRHKNGCNGEDEEERMMDKLLMHYSKKGLNPTNKADNGIDAQIDSHQKVSLHPPGRAISLPSESGPSEDVKVPARSTSLQPDCPSGRVHPKIPDFDELAARVHALRKA